MHRRAWHQIIPALAILALCFFAYPAYSQLSFSRNARTFDTVHSTLMMKGVAHACLALLELPDGLPCNPAHVPMIAKPSIDANILLSNGYSALNNVRKLLNDRFSQEVVNSMFGDAKIIQIEANSDISFRSKYLAARYTPLTVKGLSVVRNEANPEVELSTFEEKGFVFQSGYEVIPDFFVGAQLRFVDRRFIRQQFLLLDLATPQGKELIKPKTQSATYFEPGATWIIPGTWKPRVSVFVANLGTVSKEHEELYLPVQVQGGVGISPPIEFGSLDISLEYRSLSFEENPEERFHLGGVYRYGAMNLSGGIDANGLSGGIFYGVGHINAGVLYSTTKLMNDYDDDFYTQTVYVQLGWQI